VHPGCALSSELEKSVGDSLTTGAIATPTARRQMTTVVTSSIIGTTIEWYDFFLYGTVATIVFPHLFFPKASVFAGTLLSLTTFLVGFIARPIGAMVFGHFGDRSGRKSTLIVTLLLTGIATFLIGLVPGYTSIGIAAPLLVSLLRFCQGLVANGVGRSCSRWNMVMKEIVASGQVGLMWVFLLAYCSRRSRSPSSREQWGVSLLCGAGAFLFS
jgi:MFS family permease